MIRAYDTAYKVDGRALLAPDEGVEISLSDLDSSDSGRDESGVMHRFVVWEKVRTFGFGYVLLDAAYYAYLMGLFSGKSTFTFSFPENGSLKTCTAYFSTASVVLHNSRTGSYKNLKFNIIEC